MFRESAQSRREFLRAGMYGVGVSVGLPPCFNT